MQQSQDLSQQHMKQGSASEMAAVAQNSTKAIKKKSLLNFRAIKNNYVVKAMPSNSNVNMAIDESPKNMINNSSLNQNFPQSTRRAHGKGRQTHSQFASEDTRNPATGVATQKHHSNQPQSASSQMPQVDAGDPQRQSFQYSSGNRTRGIFQPYLNDSSKNPMEQSQKILPTQNLSGNMSGSIDPSHFPNDLGQFPGQARIQVLNHRLKSRGNIRRIQVTNNNGGIQNANQLQVISGNPVNHNGKQVSQSYETGNNLGRSGAGWSQERFQNNNVNSQNPSKALVSPRGGIPTQGQQIVGSIFKPHNGQQMPTTQGMSSAKNATSQPLMFSNQNARSFRQQPALPQLNTNDQSPRNIQKKLAQNSQKSNINQVSNGVEMQSRPNFHQQNYAHHQGAHMTHISSNPPPQTQNLNGSYSHRVHPQETLGSLQPVNQDRSRQKFMKRDSRTNNSMKQSQGTTKTGSSSKNRPSANSIYNQNGQNQQQLQGAGYQHSQFNQKSGQREQYEMSQYSNGSQFGQQMSGTIQSQSSSDTDPHHGAVQKQHSSNNFISSGGSQNSITEKDSHDGKSNRRNIKNLRNSGIMNSTRNKVVQGQHQSQQNVTEPVDGKNNSQFHSSASQPHVKVQSNKMKPNDPQRSSAQNSPDGVVNQSENSSVKAPESMNSSRGYKQNRPKNIQPLKQSMAGQSSGPNSASNSGVGTIPEENEKEEHTSRQIRNRSKSPVFDYPLQGKYLTSMPKSKEFLSIHELTEVQEYDEVYYLAKADKKYQPTKKERLVNNGFDDAEGYYRIVKGDQIGYRFEVGELIGKGAFGQVIKCRDHKKKEDVAIKMVKNQKKYYYQAAVEAKLLLLLKENDPEGTERVVKLMDYFVWRNHLCIVFELYSINLYEFIKMYDYQGFDYGLIRRFAIQLLSGLRYLKHLGIIHCDLKPENILMKQKDKSGIAIADFGSGCLENEIVYTYIQSRFYRAPDIMLGVFPYTQQIDMWSFGCILIELFTGFPLFPGTNEREQIQLIIDVIGMPNASVLSRSTRKGLFKQFNNESTAVPAPLEVISDSEKEKRLKYIMEKLREVPDPQFVDLISRCLEWDPLKRLTPDEGLSHEWILKGLPPGVLDSHQQQMRQGSSNQQSMAGPPQRSRVARVRQKHQQAQPAPQQQKDDRYDQTPKKTQQAMRKSYDAVKLKQIGSQEKSQREESLDSQSRKKRLNEKR